MSGSKSLQWTERLGGVLLGTLLVSGASQAEDMLDTLQMHGFLSQALVITDHNDFFGPSSRNGGSFEFTEIGANASLRPHQDVLIAAQVLSRRAGGPSSDARPKLDYGLIDYQMVSSQQRTFGVQLGRIKNPFGFYNQTRDVAFTRPSILLPQSIYFDRTRSLALTGDGATFYWEERLPTGALRAQIGIGEPQAGNDLRHNLRLDEVPGTLEPRRSAIGQLRYEHDGGRIIAAVSAADANARFRSDIPPLGTGRFRFKPWVFSLQYNAEYWSLTGEYAWRPTTMQGFNVPTANFDITGESWYLQYTRRFLDDWQWLVRYDSLVSDRNDPDGHRIAREMGLPAHSQYADDITLGLQWMPHPNVLLSTEYHRVDGTGWLPLQDNPDPSETRRRWDMLLFQFSLRF